MNTMGGAGGAVRRKLYTTMKGKIKPQTKYREEESSAAALYRRLLGSAKAGGSMTDTLNQYLREGKAVKQDDLRGCVKGLRKFNHSPQAIELMKWMEIRGVTFSGGDYAVLIDLLSQVKGIESAEEYFNKLSPSIQNKQTYGALLNCYCRQKKMDKALALFTKMSELNIPSNALNYNNLMSMYMKLGEPEKVLLLVQEMKEKCISMDTFTYNILISCYTSLKDISGAERVVKEMETEDNVVCDSTTYSSLAIAYVNAGLHEKAELVLKRLEQNIRGNDRDPTPYHMLIKGYARISNLAQVHRVWDALKSVLPGTINASYLLMLETLAKLEDIDGLKKCFQEWESGRSHYDARLMNVLIRAYLKRGMVEEVKVLCEDAIKTGSGLPYPTYEIFVDFFLRNHQLSMALRCFGVGLSKLKGSKWKACPERVSAFLKLFEEEKDVDSMKKFCEMLKRTAKLNSEVRQLLLSSHVAKNEESEIGQNLKVGDFVMSSEIKDLVEMICPH